MAYSIAAAPFVRLLGMNGFLVFHVLLLCTVFVCGYMFLVAAAKPALAAAFVLAFVGASAVPVYAIFLTPELFNFTLVFVAYFLWAVQRKRPISRGVFWEAEDRVVPPRDRSASRLTRNRWRAPCSPLCCCRGGADSGATASSSAPCP